MPSPTTSWTGAAAVNGLLAVILLAWLADTATPSQPPPQREKPAVAEPAPKPPPAAKPVPEKPMVVELPPPPRPKVEIQTKATPTTQATPKVVPLRPSPVRKPEPRVKIVALKPRKDLEEVTDTPGPKPLRAHQEPTPKPQPKKAEPLERNTSGPDRKAFTNARAEAKAMAEARRKEAVVAAAKARSEARARAAANAEAEARKRNAARVEARAHAQPSAATEVKVSRKSVRNGRHLLRILEHGKGPSIEIAWPGSRAERERLHAVLRRCYGMRLALIDGTGGLYLDEGPTGSRWQVDLDRFSGFVRRPSGHITAAESRDAARVARYHRGLPATDPVRVFPRATDAALLGGIAEALGDDYRAAKTITAAYRLRGSRVAVVDLRVDGRPVAGGIDLSRGAAPACRATG